MRPRRRKRDANDVVKGRGARSMKSEHLLSWAAGRVGGGNVFDDHGEVSSCEDLQPNTILLLTSAN